MCSSRTRDTLHSRADEATNLQTDIRPMVGFSNVDMSVHDRINGFSQPASCVASYDLLSSLINRIKGLSESKPSRLRFTIRIVVNYGDSNRRQSKCTT